MNKKTIIALIALVLVAAIMAGIYFATRPDTGKKDTDKETVSQTDEGTEAAGNTFTLVVVHGDKTEKTFTITSTKEFLAQALIDEGIITDEGVETGMYFTVDGETASWEENKSYWALYIGEDYATTGADGIVVTDGGEYGLVYTIG